MTKTLYVFFHGLVSLVEFDKRFRAILINMSGHREALGHFLTERSIPQGVSLTLNGVAGANGSLDPKANLILDNAQLDPAAMAQLRYADIYLPKPDKIMSFCTADASEKLTGTTANLTSKNYSAIQVFQYTVLPAGFTHVSLTGSGFEFDCAGHTDLPGGDQFATIHILNEPETAASDAHAVDEFGKGSKLFGSDLRLSSSLPFPGTKAPTAIAGLLPEEFLPLADREASVLPMLDVLRVGAPRSGGGVGGGRFCGACHGRVHQ
jgi:hypothetical protein